MRLIRSVFVLSSWICWKCHYQCDAKEFRYRLLLLIFDGVQFINVSIFGHHLEPFFGCSANEFQKCVVFYYIYMINYCQSNLYRKC